MSLIINVGLGILVSIIGSTAQAAQNRPPQPQTAQAKPAQPASAKPAGTVQQPQNIGGLMRKTATPQTGTLAARATTPTPVVAQKSAQPAATPGSLQDTENQLNALLGLIATE